MILGCDTGFFAWFIAKNPVVRRLMEEAARGEHGLVSSVICIYELKKLGLTGMVSREAAFGVASELPLLCEVVFLDDVASSLIDQAARLSHGNALSMADALILSSVLSRGAERLYTVDSDMARYKGDIEVVNLRAGV